MKSPAQVTRRDKCEAHTVPHTLCSGECVWTVLNMVIRLLCSDFITPGDQLNFRGFLCPLFTRLASSCLSLTLCSSTPEVENFYKRITITLTTQFGATGAEHTHISFVVVCQMLLLMLVVCHCFCTVLRDPASNANSRNDAQKYLKLY